MNSTAVKINPRVVAAIFFAALMLLFLFFTKLTLLSLPDNQLFPILPSIFFALFTGLLVGAISGKSLATSGHWCKPLIIGIALALTVLLLISTTLFILSSLHNSNSIQSAPHWQDYFIIFGVLFLSMFLIIGTWLIPLVILATIYFNRRFFPGLVALEQQQRSQTLKVRDNES